MRVGIWALLPMAMITASVQASPQLRGPVAVEFLRQGHLACVANQKKWFPDVGGYRPATSCL